jgi:hypothetical protein
MKNYTRELGLGLALASIFAGLLIWFMVGKIQDPLKIGIAVLVILLGIGTFSWRIVNKKSDLKMGVPAEDEFTKRAKAYAGNQAFEYSMFLWLLIFIFNSSFTKAEPMLGVGILGSALIYGICLWYYKTTGAFNED